MLCRRSVDFNISEANAGREPLSEVYLHSGVKHLISFRAVNSVEQTLISRRQLHLFSSYWDSHHNKHVFVGNNQILPTLSCAYNVKLKACGFQKKNEDLYRRACFVCFRCDRWRKKIFLWWRMYFLLNWNIFYESINLRRYSRLSLVQCNIYTEKVYQF